MLGTGNKKEEETVPDLNGYIVAEGCVCVCVYGGEAVTEQEQIPISVWHVISHLRSLSLYIAREWSIICSSQLLTTSSVFLVFRLLWRKQL